MLALVSDSVERSDLELLEAWRDGDARSGDQLFRRNFDRIYGFFASKVPEQAVGDLIQETMLGCVQGASRFRGEGSFRAYLLGVARNVLLASFRTKRRNQRIDFDASITSLQDLGQSPTQQRWERQEMRLVAEALRHLPLDLQIALELHYFEAMNTADIAIVLELPQGTVKSRLRRAREQLEEIIAKIGDSVPLVTSTTRDLDRWARSIRQARTSE
jgi:RNA polymerase sigma-70 factor (ECF subfamily)